MNAVAAAPTSSSHHHPPQHSAAAAPAMTSTTTNASCAAVLSPHGAHQVQQRQHQLFAFRAAIALNNMAVTLMSRACYNQAFDTIRDAVVVMNTGVARPSVTSNPARMFQAVSVRLENGKHRLAHPRMDVIQQHEQLVTVVTVDASLDYCPPEVVVPPSRHQLPQQPCSIIRIGDQDDFDVFTEAQDTHLPSAILLYNMAVASLCHASTVSDEPALAASLQDASLTHMRFSRNILCKLLETCKNPFVMARIIYVLSVLLRTMIQALEGQGNLSEATSCLLTMEHLQKLSSQIICLESLRGSRSAAAA